MALSGKYWPLRPPILPGEVLTSWLVRVAHAHLLSAQIFYDRTIGHSHPIWSRDLDRHPPMWLMQLLAQKTGKRLADLQALTLIEYKGTLFNRKAPFGKQDWVLPINKYHRIHQGFGMQFCPLCLREDTIPYFRKVWRLALYTFCPSHNIILHDRCPQCGKGVAFHRQTENSWDLKGFAPLSICIHCGFNMAASPVVPVPCWNENVFQIRKRIIGNLASSKGEKDHWNKNMSAVLHHLCAILAWQANLNPLLQYIQKQSGLPEVTLSPDARAIENRSPIERHFLLDAVWWLMEDYPNRLRDIWKSGTMPCSHLLRNKHKLPQWFIEDVRGVGINK